ncbi:MAG: hypothetical protein K0R70_1149 [Steroidobacteraceae bacterium]|nr:hypothetical protein [Steroidobacteraceae bacterium]
MAERDRDRNRDPITGAEGSHPLGTAGGAFAGGAAGGVAGAAVAGAAAGSAAGPAGTLIGAAVGAVAGGLAGKAIAERINPTVEEEYWRTNYSSRPYVTTGARYDDYGPAYRMGYERYPEYHGRKFDEVEHEFARDWDARRGDSKLSWNEARHATRDAFQRASDTVERWTPGDSDRDGK